MGKEIRIGDTERNESRALLDIHLAEGRLTIAEHEERLALAGVARIRGELAALFADLPAPHPKAVAKTATPASFALGVVAVLALFAGMPAAIVVMIAGGPQWYLFAVAALVIVSGSVSTALEKPDPHG